MSAARHKHRVGTLPARRRRAVHWIAIGTWLTGAIWLIFKYFVRVTDEFGFDNPHPMQQWWLTAHAVVAVFAVWMFGVLWPGHILRGWNSHLRRPTGGTLFGIMAFLTLSGVALYYLGSDRWRSWISILHWAVGLGALIAFLLHRRHGD